LDATGSDIGDRNCDHRNQKHVMGITPGKPALGGANTAHTQRLSRKATRAIAMAGAQNWPQTIP
jgi:hypothetical protein